MRRLRLWVVRILLRDELSKIQREIDEEFRFHLDMKTAALVAGGMVPERARAAALESFGDSEALREAAARHLSEIRTRERQVARLDWLGRDVGDGLRQMKRHPGFTMMAVATLALGLSTSTAVFTYVNAYSRPFPGADAEGLHQVYLSSEDAPYGALSFPDFEDLTSLVGGLYGVAGVSQTLFAASVRHDDLTEVVFGQGVTGSYFSVLRVGLALGRGVSSEDDRPQAPPAVVISHAYWVSRYRSAPDVLGRTILLNNQPYTIIGVAGRDFVGSSAAFRPQVWLPFEQYMRVYWARSDTRANRETSAIFPLLRVADGETSDQARESLRSLAQGLDQEAPLADRSRTFTLEPATWISPATRDSEASTTRIMMLAAACLLLLACANVANLVLSAGARRYREMALRSAMGASRWRLVRQLVTESVLLSTLAGAVALLVAGPVGGRLSSYFASPSVWGSNVPREIVVDPRVMLFALMAAVLTGIVTGIVPALRTSGRNPASALNAGGAWASPATAGPKSKIPGAQDLLVSVQIGLTVVLLFVAGLVLRTLDAAQHVDAGFDAEQTLASYVSTSSMGVPVAERHQFFQELIRRFQELPWVVDATVAENAPLSGHPVQELRMETGADLVPATVARVWPGYFEVMEMEILQGRPLEATDTVDDNGVVVVNESLARRVAADGSAVGRMLWWPGEGETPDRGFQVIGVVRNARQTTFLDEPEPVAYFSLPQHYSAPGNAFLVKVGGNPAAAVDRMEQALRGVDTRIAIVNILPYGQVVGGFLYTQRMNAELFGVIAVLGLILATAGVFGVVALAVARRRREIGIRVAVGADRAFVVRLVVATVYAPLVIGLALGLAGAFVATRLVEGLLWGVAPSDPVAVLSGAAILAMALTLAIAVPVARALKVDPVVSLRAE
ncbi:MAG TPA: ADOP family duplicated permease [Longimicrobiales bacterium]|nr:ADOP family duplicated permease [Longimicrobiales bacterium]